MAPSSPWASATVWSASGTLPTPGTSAVWAAWPAKSGGSRSVLTASVLLRQAATNLRCGTWPPAGRTGPKEHRHGGIPCGQQAFACRQADRQPVRIERNHGSIVRRRQWGGDSRPRPAIELRWNSATGELLALGGWDSQGGGTLRVLEIATGKDVFTTSPAGGMGDVAMEASDGRLVACCDKFGTAIQVWDLKERKLVRTLRGHTGWINAIEFADGRLVSCSWDNTIKFGTPQPTRNSRDCLDRQQEWSARAAFSPDTSRVAIVQGDNIGSALPILFGDPGAAVTVWDPVAGKARTRSKATPRPPAASHFLLTASCWRPAAATAY